MTTVSKHLTDMDILLGVLEKFVRARNLPGNPENLFGYLRVNVVDCAEALPDEVLELEADFDKPSDISEL